MKTVITILLLALPLAARGEYRSLAELAGAYSDQSCKGCHQQVHGEWGASRHSRSVVDSLGITRDFIVTGLGGQWRSPVSKEHLMRCMECHAPQLEEGSEELAREVAGLIVAAVDGKEEKAREAARLQLAGLSVTCIVCHNSRAVLEGHLKGPPEKGVYYGPTGKASPAHGTGKSAAITSPLFCGQCHRTYTPPDREIIFCSSLYESYQDAYRSGGGTRTCQECHMHDKGRGHRMPGAWDQELLREGIVVASTARGIRVQPGKWLPAALVEVNLTGRAGHRTPDG